MKHAPLIEVEDLVTLLGSTKLILLDASIDKVNKPLDRENIELIPNSMFFDVEGVLSDHTSGLPHTMVDEQTFTKEMQLLGIDSDSIVVIYDRWGVYASPRAWWMLTYMGHEHVYVLNGGLPAWTKAGKPVVDRHSKVTSTGHFVSKKQDQLIAYKEDILKNIGSAAVTITDARSPARFAGDVAEPRPGIRAGHIPKSTNLYFEDLLQGTYYKPVEEMHSLINKHTSPDKVNIFSCGSGITASILALAAYATGNQNISVYDGSWAEWGADRNLPIE